MNMWHPIFENIWCFFNYGIHWKVITVFAYIFLRQNICKTLLHQNMVISAKSSKRQFSHLRFIFLLIVVLNTLDNKHRIGKQQNLHKTYLKDDIHYCRTCFTTQLQHCEHIFEQLRQDEEFSVRLLLSILPKVTYTRNNQMMVIKNTTNKIVAKYLLRKKLNLKMGLTTTSQDIKKYFLAEQNTLLDGMQYTPLRTVDEFVKQLEHFHNYLPDRTIWLYFIHNIQLVLLPLLYQLKFPVPQTYGVCGFTLFQKNAGLDLYYFYTANFPTKMKIAQKLLEASMKFSYGFDKYRLYITDLTADNIVYDVTRNELTFIDLDTVLIVDFSQAKYKSSIHKHQYIECLGCFAYSPDDISSFNISDINIYSACQFLREDLYKQRNKGFLNPIPVEISSAYPSLWQLLDKCVDCPDSICLERFTVAKNLIKLFQEILD